MKHSKLSRLLILISLTGLCATAALAEGRGQGRGQERGGGRHGFLPSPELLDLTEAQKQAAQALIEDLRLEAQPLRQTQSDLRQQLLTLSQDANADPAAIGTLVKQIQANRDQLKTLAQAAEADFVALLDSAQKAKYDIFRELREERREHRGERREGFKRGK
jgi:Spy/CpxP family protein refolding chaperone